jgi:hypothetical protein
MYTRLEVVTETRKEIPSHPVLKVPQKVKDDVARRLWDLLSELD